MAWRVHANRFCISSSFGQRRFPPNSRLRNSVQPGSGSRFARSARKDKNPTAVHAIALRNDPVLESELVPLLNDKKEAVRVRAAAGYLRLESIKSERPDETATSRKRRQRRILAGLPKVASATRAINSSHRLEVSLILQYWFWPYLVK